MENEQTPSITRGQTLMNIPYKGGITSFVYPGKGPGTYTDTCQAVLKDGLDLPTGEQTAYLLDAVYHALSEEPEAQSIRGLMKSNWDWTPNKNLWVPQSHGYKGNAGVFKSPASISQNEPSHSLGQDNPFCTKGWDLCAFQVFG